MAGKAVQFSEGLLEIGGNCYFLRFYHRMITNLFYTVDTGSTFEEREEVLAMYNENDENRFEENQDRAQQEQVS